MNTYVERVVENEKHFDADRVEYFSTPDDYPYMYETHVHTLESSKCAVSSAVDMAKAHKAAGYTGMIITNHNWGGNTCVDTKLSWCDFLDNFFEPYYRAKKWADANDFQVFYGYEAGYDGTEFLIYGITIEWMKAHPELRDATVEEQFQLIDAAGGLVVHAHPFRETWYIAETRLFPEHVHAVEGLNASHSSPYIINNKHKAEFNDRAVEYALKLGMPITGGSDTHNVELIGGGTAFRRKLSSIEDYVEQIKTTRDYVVTDGGIWLDSYGRRINK